jgi:chitinase
MNATCDVGRRRLLWIPRVLFLACVGISIGGAAERNERWGGAPIFFSYYASWNARADTSSASDEVLSDLPPEIGIVALAFARPDMTFLGESLSGSGLEMPYKTTVLITSIQKLRRRNPHVKILVSIGGESYTAWQRLDAKAIAGFVKTLGLDGIDIDFEPLSPNCHAVGARITCDTDPLLTRVVASLRAALPRPLVLSLSVVNVGAYGEKAWRNSKPVGSESYGLDLAVLRDPSFAAQIDLISIMAYDAGPSYRPDEALAAIRSYFEGPILVGFTPPPEAWGGHRYSTREVDTVLRNALNHGGAGAMLFSIGKPAPQNPSLESPDAARLIDTISSVICTPRSNGAPRQK